MAMFELFNANVFFIEENASKVRPILQISNDTTTPVCFAEVSSELWHKSSIDILLDDWRAANLHKPSLVRLSERCGKPATSKQAFGKLNRHDIKKVIDGLKNVININIHKVEELDDNFTISTILNEVMYE